MRKKSCLYVVGAVNLFFFNFLTGRTFLAVKLYQHKRKAGYTGFFVKSQFF